MTDAGITGISCEIDFGWRIGTIGSIFSKGDWVNEQCRVFLDCWVFVGVREILESFPKFMHHLVARDLPPGTSVVQCDSAWLRGNLRVWGVFYEELV